MAVSSMPNMRMRGQARGNELPEYIMQLAISIAELSSAFARLCGKVIQEEEDKEEGLSNQLKVVFTLLFSSLCV